MNRAEFDKLFDEAFEKVVKEQPLTPDPDESWNSLKDRISAVAGKRTRARRKYAAIAAAVLLAAMVFGSPAISEAYNPFRQFIKFMQQDAVSFIFRYDANRRGLAKTSPPPEDLTGHVLYEDNARKVIYRDWEEAKAMMAATPPAIAYIPDTYQLDQAMLFFYEGSRADRAMLFYSSPDSDSMFTIVMQMMGENEIYTSTSDLAAGPYSEMELNGAKGYLLKHHDGAITLELMTGRFVVVISGQLPEEEIVRIGKSVSLQRA